MGVRTRGAAGRSDVADHLTLLNAHARAHALGEALHVGIGRLVSAIVADADVDAVGAVAARVFDDPVAGGHDRRATRGREVDAAVHLGIAKDRVFAPAETRAQPGAIDRCLEQGAAGALPARVEIFGRSVV